MLTAVSAVLVVALAPPPFTCVGGLGEGRTPLAVACPLLVTTTTTLKLWPRLSGAGTVTDVTTNCGGVWTVTVLEVALAALTAAPELASVPVAPATSASVPGPVPFSVNVHVKTTLAPPAMVAGVSVLEVVALAPPVPDTLGGLGEGSTPLAAAWPPLCTTMVAVKVCPRDRVPGAMTKEEMLSAAACCTLAVFEFAAAAVTVAPEFRSVPVAPVLSRSVPVPVPVSVYVQVKVALPRPGMSTGVSEVEVVALAWPVVVGVGGFGDGRTLCAVAWPLLFTTSTAVKVEPRLMLAGRTNEETARAAGVSTGIWPEPAPGAVTVAPELASVPVAPVVKVSEPVPVPFS